GLDACSWLDEYIEFSKNWSPRSYDGYHEAVGLWLLSTIAARRVAITNFGKERYTNLYIILVGRTTLYAKSTVVQIGKELLQKIGLDFLLLPDESTPQRMIKDMSVELPDNYDKMNAEQKDRVKLIIAFTGQRGWFFDEFGQNIHLMMRKDGPYSEFRGLFRKFDDTEPKYERSTISRGKETVYRPYLALLGILTPADIAPFAKMGAILWGDGYLARMALIVPPEGLITEGQFPEEERVFPESLLKPLVDWNKRLGNPKIKIEGGKITAVEPPASSKLVFTKEVREAYYRYD
ncbi:MAG: DUF3987 domain-containing protein, partial [Candidatus Methanomethylicus sp.]|nr:DUF3987 domain-containing protein [Candidatus Methanomethylicus sp.]